MVVATRIVHRPDGETAGLKGETGMQIEGVIFDLDGTLVDSALDFDQIRADMGVAADDPILESLETMTAERRQQCEQVLLRHELQGVERAAPFPGVIELLRQLIDRGLRLAIVTRNRADCALATIEATLPACWDPVISRDDGPIKPDPWGIREICRQWEVDPASVVMIGDYVYDIESGRQAGARTALFARGRDRDELTGVDIADHGFDSFDNQGELLAWLLKPL
jgi:HAD superfamily hydrolase (TIGR01509 family)